MSIWTDRRSGRGGTTVESMQMRRAGQVDDETRWAKVRMDVDVMQRLVAGMYSVDVAELAIIVQVPAASR